MRIINPKEIAKVVVGEDGKLKIHLKSGEVIETPIFTVATKEDLEIYNFGKAYLSAHKRK